MPLRCLDADGLNLNLVAYAPETTIPLSSIPINGLSAIALEHGNAVVANDYPSHPQAVPDRLPEGAMSVVALPVRSVNATVGVLNISAPELNHFTPDKVRLLNAVVDGLGVLLENARLHDETNKLALALESIGDGVSFTDREGNFQFVNRAWGELHGYVADEVIGKHYTILIKEVEDQQKAELIQEEAYRTGWSGELKRVGKDGVEFDTRKTLTPVKNEDGNTIGIITVTQDSSGPHHQDSGEAKIRESTAGVSRKPSSDCKACGCSSKHLCGLTAWNT